MYGMQWLLVVTVVAAWRHICVNSSDPCCPCRRLYNPGLPTCHVIKTAKLLQITTGIQTSRAISVCDNCESSVLVYDEFELQHWPTVSTDKVASVKLKAFLCALVW